MMTFALLGYKMSSVHYLLLTSAMNHKNLITVSLRLGGYITKLKEVHQGVCEIMNSQAEILMPPATAAHADA